VTGGAQSSRENVSFLFPRRVGIDIKVSMLCKYARAHLINLRSPRRKERGRRLQIYVREVFLSWVSILGQYIIKTRGKKKKNYFTAKKYRRV